MRRLILALALWLAPLGAVAQEDDRGFLVGLIEDSLSGDGRVVRLEGFAGALSSRATFETLTIADAGGVWLTIRQGAITWNRSALLSRRIEIAEMSAAEIVLDRLPESGETGTVSGLSAAREFSLPALPVSVAIGSVGTERLTLGPTILGQPVMARVAGSVALGGGDGRADLTLERTDGRTGRVAVAAGFTNSLRELVLDLTAEEGPEGIAVSLLGVPGAPEAALSVTGKGPLDAFRADVTLSTEGERRMEGSVTLSGAAGGGTGFAVDLAGDLAPLFAPDYRAFFGPRIALRTVGQRGADGALALESLALSSDAVRATGSLDLAADGLPRKLALDVTLGLEGGAPVLLPLSGTETRLEAADLSLTFDAAQSDAWSATGTLSGLSRGLVRVGQAEIDGTGRIARGGAGGVSADTVDGTLAFRAEGLDPGNPAIASALGGQLEGGTSFRWQRGGALDLHRFTAGGDGYGISGSLALADPSRGIEAKGSVLGSYGDLARLSALAGRPLTGAAEVSATGSYTLLTGAFDGEISVEGADIGIGAARLDRLLSGAAKIEASLVRDAAGTTIRRATVASGTLDGRAEGRVTPETEDLSATFRLADLSALDSGWGGQASLDATSRRDRGERVVTAIGTLTDAGFGVAEIDRVLAGETRLDLVATGPEGDLRLTSVSLENPRLAARALGGIGLAAGAATVEARLADMALLAPGFPGPLSVSGDISAREGGFALELSGTGPGATRATAKGTVSRDLARADLAFKGSFQSAILSPFIAPRKIGGPVAFDLRLSGRPALSSLSGRLGMSGGRLSDPAFGIGLEGLTADATVSGGAAEVRLNAGVAAGGRVSAGGRVGLAPPNTTDLAVTLDRARLRDPGLYEARLSGDLTVTGAVRNLRISGATELREAELRIPTTGFGTQAFAGDIRHLNEGTASRRTRERAGLVGTGAAGTGRGGTGTPVALDVTVSAPQRIFVRGRGLDAELGGSLRLTGTTASVVPVGEFSLIRGRLDLLGKRFDIDEGAVRMEGELIPSVRFLASAESEGTVASILIEGQADAPRISFTSAPPLPEEEIVARLLFGRGLTSLSPFQAAQLASAIASLTGRGGEGIVGRLRSSFGLDDLDVQTGADGTLAVRAGKYLSRNLYTDVTVGGGGTTEINLNLDVSKSVTVRGSLASDGGTGLGVYYERDY
jgi:translocation and assembly module TamB